MKRKAAVHLIMNVDGMTLVSRRKNTGYFDGYFGLVAGHIEDGELPFAAMLREAKEEANMTLDPLKLSLVSTGYCIRPDGTMYSMYFFSHPLVKYENAEPEKCSGLYWVHQDYPPKKTIPYIKHVLMTKQAYFEFDERTQ